MTDTTIDINALTKLKAMIGGNVDDLTELVDDFLTTLPDQLQAMRAAQDGQDWPALRIAAHSCKSNARDLGASHLSSLCAALELQCRSENITDLNEQLSTIDDAAQQAIASLKEMDLSVV